MKKITIAWSSYLFAVFLMVILLTQVASAHVVVRELSQMSATDTCLAYLGLGFKHILPLGFDHILFIIGIYLLSPKLKPLLVQATFFTMAHSITLGLAMYQVITPPSLIIEPLIAFSIVLVAIENIFWPRLKPSRVGIIFLFGLVHGMGFAGALSSIGLPKSDYLLGLVMFNIGVEIGQLTIILAAYWSLTRWFGHKTYYRKYIVVPLSILIAGIASAWTIQRIFFPS